MKLSTLVGQQVGINKISLDSTKEIVNDTLSKIINDIDAVNIDGNGATNDLLAQAHEIFKKFDDFADIVNTFKDQLDQTISTKATEYYQKSIKIYNESLNDNPTYTADRYLFSGYLKREEVKQTFISRLELYSSWKHPGLFIRPETGEIVEPLLSNDPLYIADENEELLLMTKKRWTPQYQARIRYNYVNEDRDVYLSGVPQGQLGLIVAYHFFNYKPLDVIKQYLNEFYKALKPGGVAVITYNNCDLPEAVIQVEHAYQTYIPKSTLLPIVESLGFEVTDTYDFETNVSWIEIKKPGELTSLRGGQALAQIKDSRLDN